MVNAVNDRDDPVIDVKHDPVGEPDATLSDGALLDLLDALVDERGRVPAARVLGVNCRTPAICCGCRQVSRRTRQALAALRDAGGSTGDKADTGHPDDTATVGDATVVIGPVSATGLRGAEGRFFAGTPFQGGSMMLAWMMLA